jgi:hypothetical protein
VGKSSLECVVERVVGEGPRDTAVFVLGFDRDRADVQGLVKRSATNVEGKRQTLGDTSAKVLNHVVVDLVVSEGF